MNYIVDGFQIADTIKKIDPESYEFLTKFPFEWYFTAPDQNIRYYKPVITVGHENNIEQIRFNDLDRAPPPTLSEKELTAYYKALNLFSELINKKENKFEIALTPGKVLIVNNWRVLHARSSYEGKRRICGCYVAIDQFRSKLNLITTPKPFI